MNGKQRIIQQRVKYHIAQVCIQRIVHSMKAQTHRNLNQVRHFCEVSNTSGTFIKAKLMPRWRRRRMLLEQLCRHFWRRGLSSSWDWESFLLEKYRTLQALLMTRPKFFFSLRGLKSLSSDVFWCPKKKKNNSEESQRTLQALLIARPEFFLRLRGLKEIVLSRSGQ